MLREAVALLTDVRAWHGNTPAEMKGRIDAWLADARKQLPP
jgi:hypothetical protein